jgi:hypothetical protein
MVPRWLRNLLMPAPDTQTPAHLKNFQSILTEPAWKVNWRACWQLEREVSVETEREARVQLEQEVPVAAEREAWLQLEREVPVAAEQEAWLQLEREVSVEEEREVRVQPVEREVCSPQGPAQSLSAQASTPVWEPVWQRA